MSLCPLCMLTLASQSILYKNLVNFSELVVLGTLDVTSSTQDTCTHCAHFWVVELNTKLEFGQRIPMSPINS